jgi:hypothetical protein
MSSSTAPELELSHYRQQQENTVNHEVESQRSAVLSQEAPDGFSLPPTDGGKDAWLFLFACFMLEGLIWGTYLYKSIKMSEISYLA